MAKHALVDSVRRDYSFLEQAKDGFWKGNAKTLGREAVLNLFGVDE